MAALGLTGLVLPGYQFQETLVLILLIVFGLLILGRVYVAARIYFKRDIGKVGKMDIDVADSGIRFASAKGNGECYWSAFVRYAETKNLFVLYQQSILFNAIPKRAFEPADLAAFQQLLQQNLGEKSAAYDKKCARTLAIALAITGALGLVVISIFIYIK